MEKQSLVDSTSSWEHCLVNALSLLLRSTAQRKKKRFIYYLLLVDNEPDHRRALLKMHSKTYAIFTPPETESILQPTRGYFTVQV